MMQVGVSTWINLHDPIATFLHPERNPLSRCIRRWRLQEDGAWAVLLASMQLLARLDTSCCLFAGSKRMLVHVCHVMPNMLALGCLVIASYVPCRLETPWDMNTSGLPSCACGCR